MPPARVLRIHEPAVGLEAVVVIDHVRFPVAAGGTRMAPGVTEDEVARLARAMTYKFAVYGHRIAGAKGGIDFSGGDRAAVLGAYQEAIRPWRDVFLTGPDMGTAPEDFLPPGGFGDRMPMWARTHEGRGMDDLATGQGVATSAEVALERSGRALAGAAVAIEGFGKAGSGAAIAFAKAGARVVAVSTVAGMIHDRDGLDVAELLALRDEHGDAFVEHARVPAQPRGALFELACDVLVPGARPSVVTTANASALRCSAVVPAANIPYGRGAAEALAARGILAVPDFVANAGGVHLYESRECQGDDPAACLESVARINRDGTERVLERADRDGATPMEAAILLANEFLAAASPRAPGETSVERRAGASA
jgi:glutamate dehydrogenase (NAD(P)+)